MNCFVCIEIERKIVGIVGFFLSQVNILIMKIVLRDNCFYFVLTALGVRVLRHQLRRGVRRRRAAASRRRDLSAGGRTSAGRRHHWGACIGSGRSEHRRLARRVCSRRFRQHGFWCWRPGVASAGGESGRHQAARPARERAPAPSCCTSHLQR